MDKLIELSVEKLFQKFGAGNHKPGSGSASAFQGMLSAQLIRTVIELTTNEKRKRNYEEWISQMMNIYSEIERRIYPALEALFQQDSEQFDKAIKLREARDKEPDPLRKKKLATQALQELKPATEIPIGIARLSAELADFSAFMFDHGFNAARGDSLVALNSAISAVAGCLSIVELNLLSYISDDWTEQIRRDLDFLRNHYHSLLTKNMSRIETLSKEANDRNLCHKEIQAFRSGSLHESALSYADIEKMVTDLQNALWTHREIIWRRNTPDNAIDVINAPEVLNILGYEFNAFPTLGQHNVEGDIFEIAGIIDNENKIVHISQQFPLETRSFTTAHELGHALLHKQRVLHRDRALDGSNTPSRNLLELQADKFAAYFLMPQKQVRKIFRDIFSAEKLVINEALVFALNESSVKAFRTKCANSRGFARYLASIEYFKGHAFNSISKIFRVSEGAMAIRIEELGLIEF